MKCETPNCPLFATWELTSYPGAHRHHYCDDDIKREKREYERLGWVVRTEYMFPYFG